MDATGWPKERCDPRESRRRKGEEGEGGWGGDAAVWGESNGEQRDEEKNINGGSFPSGRYVKLEGFPGSMD